MLGISIKSPEANTMARASLVGDHNIGLAGAVGFGFGEQPEEDGTQTQGEAQRGPILGWED